MHSAISITYNKEMKTLDRGHKYLLQDNKATTTTELTFFKDEKINGSGYAGTTNQEVLRALIDRVKFLNVQVPSEINDRIIRNLREALILHEIRHLERLLDRGETIELIKTKQSGHFV